MLPATKVRPVAKTREARARATEKVGKQETTKLSVAAAGKKDTTGKHAQGMKKIAPSAVKPGILQSIAMLTPYASHAANKDTRARLASTTSKRAVIANRQDAYG